MLRQAMALASSLQIGLRVKEAVRRQAIQAGLAALAGLLLLALVVLVGMQLAQRRRERHAVPAFGAGDPARQALGHGNAATEALSDLDRRLGQVVQQVGPLSVIAAAFAVGMAAGRRRDRS